MAITTDQWATLITELYGDGTKKYLRVYQYDSLKASVEICDDITDGYTLVFPYSYSAGFTGAVSDVAGSFGDLYRNPVECGYRSVYGYHPYRHGAPQ